MRLVTQVSVVLVTVVLFSTLFGNASEEPAIHEISGFVVGESGVPVDGALIEVFVEPLTQEQMEKLKAPYSE